MTADVAMWDEIAAKRTPRRKADRLSHRLPGVPERDIQRSIIRALRKMGFLCFSIPNGAHLKGGQFQWASLKADGAMPGAPDILVWDRDGECAALEVKTATGRVSDRQAKMHEQLRARRVRVAVVRSLDDVLACLKVWGWQS